MSGSIVLLAQAECNKYFHIKFKQTQLKTIHSIESANMMTNLKHPFANTRTHTFAPLMWLMNWTEIIAATTTTTAQAVAVDELQSLRSPE